MKQRLKDLLMEHMCLTTDPTKIWGSVQHFYLCVMPQTAHQDTQSFLAVARIHQHLNAVQGCHVFRELPARISVLCLFFQQAVKVRALVDVLVAPAHTHNVWLVS